MGMLLIPRTLGSGTIRKPILADELPYIVEAGELAILASQRACMRVGAPGYEQHAGAVRLTPSAPRPERTGLQFPPNVDSTNENGHPFG